MFTKKQLSLNDDALHFKLTRSVLKIASFEHEFKKKMLRLVLNAKCEIVVFTSVIVL